MNSYEWLGFVLTVIGTAALLLGYQHWNPAPALGGLVSLIFGVRIILETLNPNHFESLVRLDRQHQGREDLHHMAGPSLSTSSRHDSSMNDKDPNALPGAESYWIRYYFQRAQTMAIFVETSNAAILLTGMFQLYIDTGEVHSLILTIYQAAFLLSSVGLAGVAFVTRLSQSSTILDNLGAGGYNHVGRSWIWLADKAMHFIVASILVMALGLGVRLSIFLPKLSTIFD